MQNERFADPSREDHFDFLVRCYFGEGKDPLRLCVQRAYLDLNRTLHGFAGHKGAGELREGAHQLVATLVDESRKAAPTQHGFDAWHRDACASLRTLYWQDGFDRFTFGQAQKWLNMTLKYVFTLGEARLPGFEHQYAHAHIPIDNVFVLAARPYGGPPLPMPWSRLDDYTIYFDLQRQYRAMFEGSAPLAAEFRLWIAAESGI
jgi:hypothetical protein